MKIVVCARCYNNEEHIERFLYGYSFADRVIISDGGSTDNSIKFLKQSKKVNLHHFDQLKEKDGIKYNEDNPHMNFVLNKAKELESDWLIFDDIDDVPNFKLRENARDLLENVQAVQVNAFRLYMWGEKEYFPKMNDYFNERYTSLWAWQPSRVHISADLNENHGTLMGLNTSPYRILPPMCLLHFSWNEKSVEEKKRRYEAMGIEFKHPFEMVNAGKPVEVPEWARL